MERGLLGIRRRVGGGGFFFLQRFEGV